VTPSVTAPGDNNVSDATGKGTRPAAGAGTGLWAVSPHGIS